CSAPRARWRCRDKRLAGSELLRLGRTLYLTSLAARQAARQRAARGAGSRSLREVEQLTAELTPAVRAKLGIPRRVPDTTLRDALAALEPDDVRPALHAATRAAQRRKALEPNGLPFGVVSLDGKATRVPAADDFFAQRQTATADARLVGVVRTVSATLTRVAWSLTRPPPPARISTTVAPSCGASTSVKPLPRRKVGSISGPCSASRSSEVQWLLVVRRHWGVETAHQPPAPA
ncbi:MAG: hypothetical protein DYH12_22695, partial [Sorangiineae bacterium PRO1]|nr:hypothetical protein [Sorangiineae bacterium PRO1]